MGYAVRNKSTGWVLGWQLLDVPVHDPATEEIVECELEDVPSLKPPSQIADVPVPESVYMFQLRKAMRRTPVVDGYPESPDAMSALVDYSANAQDPDLSDELSAPIVRRDHGTVEELRQLFRWSHGQVDDLFRLAVTL